MKTYWLEQGKYPVTKRRMYCLRAKRAKRSPRRAGVVFIAYRPRCTWSSLVLNRPTWLAAMRDRRLKLQIEEVRRQARLDYRMRRLFSDSGLG